MTAQDVLKTILEDLGLKISQFAEQIGYPVGKLYDIQRGKTKRIRDNLLALIQANYPQYSRTWLITGEGNRFDSEKNTLELGKTSSSISEGKQLLVGCAKQASTIGIPIEGNYIVPEFDAAKADILLRLSGNALYPRYCSGDLLACRRITELAFLQWGKIYVLDTRQGIIIRHIFEHPSATDQLLCKSDNSAYPPFSVHYSEINAIYMVVGAICLE